MKSRINRLPLIVIIVEWVSDTELPPSDVVTHASEHLGSAQPIERTPIAMPAHVPLSHIIVVKILVHAVTGTHGCGYDASEHLVIFFEDVSLEKLAGLG